MGPTTELLIKIARIRIEEAQTQLNYGAPNQVLDAARVDLHLAEMALVALQDKGKPPAQAVAEVVAWSHPQSPRTCDIRALRPDIAPGLLYDAPPAPAPVATFYSKGIEDAANWVDSQRESYDNEHGRHDRDTGSFEFGNDAQREYSGTLAEIAEGIRALHPNTFDSQPAGRWVFCTEELPAPREAVIITDGRRVGEGRIGKMNAAGACPSFPEGALFGAFAVPDSWGEHFCKPVAWMPLPAAPQQDCKG